MSSSLVIIILPPDFNLKQQVLTTLSTLLSSGHFLLSCYPGIQQLMRFGFVALSLRGVDHQNVAKLSTICVWTIEIDVRPQKFSVAHRHTALLSPWCEQTVPQEYFWDCLIYTDIINWPHSIWSEMIRFILEYYILLHSTVLRSYGLSAL